VGSKQGVLVGLFLERGDHFMSVVQSVQNEFGYAVEHVYRISPADYWSACKNGSNAQSYVANMDFRVGGI